VRNQFPCVWSFDSRSGKEGTEARLTEAVRDIPPAAAVEVRKLQPYHLGEAYKEHPLWQIDRLCNIAKHMTIPISHSLVEFKTNLDQSDVETISMPRVGEICYMLTTEASERVQLHPEASSGIVFGRKELGAEIAASKVAALHEYVADTVLPRFARFFEAPS
jgi:hypothetical protein